MYIRIAIPPLCLKLVVVGFSPVGRDICYQTYFNSGDFWLEFLLSLYIFEGSVFTCQFLKNKKKKTLIVNFIIQKLKNKHTLLKKVYKLSKAT